MGSLNMSEIFALFGFDMETDVGSYTCEYRGVNEGTECILDVFKHHQATATFLFTAKAAMKCPDVVRKVKQAGHEIGCHGYQHESVGPPLFEVPGGDPILPEEIFGRLRKSTEIIEKIATVRPVSFRAPRLTAGNDLMAVLEKLDYLVDSSYAMYFYEEHLYPYHPSAEDWLKEGAMRLLQIPNFADLTIESKDPLKRGRDQWPMLRLSGAERVMESVRSMAQIMWERSRPAVFSFYLHPWEFVEIPKVLYLDEGEFRLKEALYKRTGKKALSELNKLVSLLKTEGATVTSMIDFRDMWEADYCPTHSNKSNST